jgi:UDP-N-acetylmuramate--alanine ligase
VDPVFVAAVDDLNETLGHLVRGGDIVVTMGAGDIGGAAGRLREFLCGRADQPDLDLRTNGR